MRNLRTAVLAGVAAIGVAGTAMAANNGNHVMTVALPDGSVARVEYRGDVAPKVRVEPVRFTPVQFGDAFGAVPFVMVDQIFADLDLQAAAMMHRMQALPLSPLDRFARPDLVGFGTLPERTISYRFVSTSDGNHFCSRSWQWTSRGAGQQPKLVSSSAGDCDAAAAANGDANAATRATAMPERSGAATTTA